MIGTREQEKINHVGKDKEERNLKKKGEHEKTHCLLPEGERISGDNGIVRKERIMLRTTLKRRKILGTTTTSTIGRRKSKPSGALLNEF